LYQAVGIHKNTFYRDGLIHEIVQAEWSVSTSYFEIHTLNFIQRIFLCVHMMLRVNSDYFGNLMKISLCNGDAAFFCGVRNEDLYNSLRTLAQKGSRLFYASP
jgi:hypothetical protein